MYKKQRGSHAVLSSGEGKGIKREPVYFSVFQRGLHREGPNKEIRVIGNLYLAETFLTKCRYSVTLPRHQLTICT